MDFYKPMKKDSSDVTHYLANPELIHHFFGFKSVICFHNYGMQSKLLICSATLEAVET